MRFDIDVVERDGIVYVAVDGELDLATAALLEAALAEAEATAATSVVVDLGRVPFIDSAGLEVLLRARDRSDKDGQRLRLTAGTPQVQRLFEVCGVLDELPFLPTH
jgi:anti-anti-sigma factor